MYMRVTIYTKYVVPKSVHPGAEFPHCCSTECSSLFPLPSPPPIYFHAIPLSISLKPFPYISLLLFETLHKHPLDAGAADTPKSPCTIKASICSLRALTRLLRI